MTFQIQPFGLTSNLEKVEKLDLYLRYMITILSFRHYLIILQLLYLLLIINFTEKNIIFI